MKILGVSLGTKNGNNDTMCRVALEAAKEKGAEIEFIHLHDWNMEYCSGCVACSRGLVMGKGMICTRKDDFAAFYDKLVEADGVLFVDPIFESGATGLFHTITDRMGPGHDTGMLLMLDGKLKEQGKEGLNPRLFRQKAISFVGIGGSDWALRTETDHAMFAMSPGWKVVNNEFWSWSKDVIMQDDKIERMKEIGANLGGEQSGHIIMLDSNTTGDGLLSALLLLEVIVKTGKKLSELAYADSLTKLPNRAASDSIMKKLGIIDNPPNYMFVDWMVVDGYSLHHPPKALGQTALCMFYCYGLENAAKLCTLYEDEQRREKYLERKRQMTQAVNTYLFDKEKNLYFQNIS